MKINEIYIKFSPMFLWNQMGVANVVLDQEKIFDTKKEVKIHLDKEDGHQVYLDFNQIKFKTDSINLNKDHENQVLFCGIKYNMLRLVLKAVVIMGLLVFYYFIIKIFNDSITINEYKIYYTCGGIVFVSFCIDSVLTFFIQQYPKQFIYFKRIND